MSRNQKKVSLWSNIAVLFVFATAVIIKYAFVSDTRLYWALVITIPLLLFSFRMRSEHKFKPIIDG